MLKYRSIEDNKEFWNKLYDDQLIFNKSSKAIQWERIVFVMGLEQTVLQQSGIYMEEKKEKKNPDPSFTPFTKMNSI